jgi:5-(hydroxymethyl)furfural/furfural oxidase
MVANRGAPSDYNEWVEHGAKGWGWEDVLPYFIRMERDLDVTGPLHGNSGPWPIQHVRRNDWTKFIRGLEQAAGELGFAKGDDPNGQWSDGFMPVAHNVDEAGRRASTALQYLTPEVRRRHNLNIMTEATVERILIANKRAVGVRMQHKGEQVEIAGNNVVVSAGAIGSPTLLMRSGIGPGIHLRERGILCHADLPGVGENLLEHPAVGVSAFLPRDARLRSTKVFHGQALLKWSSELQGEPKGDMYISISSRGAWHAVGERIGSMYGWVNKSRSRGRIRLSPAINDTPEIDFRMLSDSRDLVRLMKSFRLSVKLLQLAAGHGSVLNIFPSSYSKKIKSLLMPSARNAIVMGIVGPIMDISEKMRERIIKLAIGDCPPLNILMSDDHELEQHLKRVVGGVWHPCGTCRMGRPDDPNAVTDQNGHVYGLENLIVSDASIMPTITCANLNLPVIMCAEKIANGLRSEQKTQ